MTDAATETLWYFAYGSNLDPRTFLGRRRIRPVETRRAALAGYRLVFDLRIGDGERGVANLLPERGARVCGVAYRISASQAAWLDRTEGVPHGAYRRLPVRLRDDADADFAGFTYLSERRSPERKPSERYMNLLLHGARHHGLPDAWVHWLRGIELAVDERSPQLELDLPRGR